MSAIATIAGADAPAPRAVSQNVRVLIVSNHREAQRKLASAAIFIDRQIASLQECGVTVNTFDLGGSHAPVHLFRTWQALRREVRRVDPQIVHARYGTIVAALSVSAGRPAVITFCGSDLNPGAQVPFARMVLGFVLSNFAALRAARLICVSAGLREALWWRRARAVIIPDGVDLEVFTPGPRDQARATLGWSPGRPVVLFNPGNNPQKKGLDLAERAMAVARHRVPSAELHVMSNVEPDMMPLYYRASDVLVCASRYEGSPNVVKEALACNLPVVSTPVGDVPERLAGVDPSAVVPRDPAAMGEALATILLSGRRSNGREHVRHLDLRHIAEHVISVYRAAVR